MHRVIALAILATLFAACGGATGAGPNSPVRILTGEPTSLDPAGQGDAGSAAITAQLFESLTTYDADLQLRPALAETWRFDEGGRRLSFHLRPGLTFSDGSPLRPSDVVRSWLRVIDPVHPSPLASLALDIKGAEAYLRGTSKDPATVAMRADDASGDLVIELVRPATDFVTIVASPMFGVVPPGVGSDPDALKPGKGFVGSGGYVLTATNSTGLTATANARYWAGKPVITTIEMVGDLGGRNAVDVYLDGTLDYFGVDSSEAAWMRYDKTLGPQLRRVASLSVTYFGFTTTRPPFDQPKVRQAFGKAIDWRRIAALSGTSESVQVANSMVPPGIPGRSDKDFLPTYDPVEARRLLAEAGYPGGAGFPDTVLLTGGSGFTRAILDEVKRELGITMRSETMADGYFDRLSSEPPAMWSLGWVADYPGRNDFLGVLLGSGASNNYGDWSSAAFDAAIAEAVASTDAAVAAAAYDRAEAIVRDEVPVVPLVYGPGWAVARNGLLGAGQNGLGFLRMAGLAWAE